MTYLIVGLDRTTLARGTETFPSVTRPGPPAPPSSAPARTASISSLRP
jgi:hypothetical protein